MSSKKYIVIIIILLSVLAILAVAFFHLWKEITETSPYVNVYNYVPAEKSFIYQSEGLKEYGFEDYIEQKINTEKEKLTRDKRNFIDVNLQKMEINLYEEGEIIDTFPVISKGRDGSWWETAPGAYFVGDKVVTHFSSIAEAWMPYAVQFYGNFFIHGWPYDRAGRALAVGPSGGCLRMNTADAKKIFEFAERGMPVLVYEKKESSLLPALLPYNKEITPPSSIDADNFIIADLYTGEILLGKNVDSEIKAGIATDIMLALSVSEIVNLGKSIVARDWMFGEEREGIIIPNRSYTARQLVEILLTKSSTESVNVLARFFTVDYFAMTINAKARAIGMGNTKFDNIYRENENNITTLIDVAKMMRYIDQYRGFIFQIESTFNDTISENQSIFTVYKIKDKENNPRLILIIVANSKNAEEDFTNITEWIDKYFEF